MIVIENLTKSYRTPKGRHFVFRNLHFEFPVGVSVGLIGPNGAGKSTLFSLLSGTDQPDSGFIRITERVSWPVGLSGGFHGSVSGRENCRFVCRVQGCSRLETARVMSFVEDFAEIGEHFDLPVRTYSSGMRARVAFGLSMAFDFDYYLIDEVMAVGDAQFRKKSQAVFAEKLKSGKVILTSHNMGQIRAYCDVVLLLSDGKARLFESVEDGIAAYQAYVKPTENHAPGLAEGRPSPSGSASISKVLQ